MSNMTNKTINHVGQQSCYHVQIKSNHTSLYHKCIFHYHRTPEKQYNFWQQHQLQHSHGAENKSCMNQS